MYALNALSDAIAVGLRALLGVQHTHARSLPLIQFTLSPLSQIHMQVLGPGHTPPLPPLPN
jgi:hypothetical protein